MIKGGADQRQDRPYSIFLLATNQVGSVLSRPRGDRSPVAQSCHSREGGDGD